MAPSRSLTVTPVIRARSTSSSSVKRRAPESDLESFVSSIRIIAATCRWEWPLVRIASRAVVGAPPPLVVVDMAISVMTAHTESQVI